MRSLRLIREEMRKIGYSAIVNDYVFPDVFVSSSPDRKVPVAAFTHTPPSYRNAALAAVELTNGAEPEIVHSYRALGAPLLFVIEGEQVTVWEIHPQGRPTVHQKVRLDQLSALFDAHRELWEPRRIHNAKSFGFLNKSYQLDFVDVGLMPAIEGEIHGKLDRLLNETLAETVRLRVIRPGEKVSDRLVFRTVFRLLAAKVLQDRGHDLARAWDLNDIDAVLKGISGHYTLPSLQGEKGSFKETVFDAAWGRLRSGINFRNISSDDLAFVYENTLVTDETREHFGVHSTPRSVAEYVVSRLNLWADDICGTRIYEPFAGAGVFMVAALRRLRDLLPVEMRELEKHNLLVNQIAGDEIEPFATEVAMLSLILADYPNENGWAVSTIDLFQDYAIASRAQGARIVLCNPPFEKFTERERKVYPKAAARSPRKPIAVLDAILDANPEALGFVLPESFIDGPHYRRQRERLEKLYKTIEIVSLPDRVFKASVIRSSLLIAQEPRKTGEATTTVRSTVVSVRDRDRFLNSGEVSETRTTNRPMGHNRGRLWIDELDELWEALGGNPKFGMVADVHRGIEWNGDQSVATRTEPQEGFCPGIHSGDVVRAFRINEWRYLDVRPERLRGGAINLPWSHPKLIANAARTSRGPWCFAAAVDRAGLVASQQLFGIWPIPGESSFSLATLCALLNSPVALAYIASRSPPDRIRVATVKSTPIPYKLPGGIDELVGQYTRILEDCATSSQSSADFTQIANQILYEIDATVLEAYDLPPRLERRVLEYFGDEVRPTLHEWVPWFPQDFKAYLPLRRYISDEFKMATSGWVLKIFKPLPEDEISALRQYLD